MQNFEDNLPWLIPFSDDKKKELDNFLNSLKSDNLSLDEIRKKILFFSKHDFSLNLSNKFKNNLAKVSDKIFVNFRKIKFNIFSDDITNYVSENLFTAGLKHNLHIDSNSFSLDDFYSKLNNINKSDLTKSFKSEFSLLWPSSVRLFHNPSKSKANFELVENQIKIIENIAMYLSSIGSQPILALIGPYYNFFNNSSDFFNANSEQVFINKFNEAIINICIKNNWTLWNLNSLIQQIGIENFWDPVNYNFAKLSVSLNSTKRVSENIVSHLAFLTGQNRRAIILDLDNTLWGGIVGDDGIENIKVGFGDAQSEAFLRFQNTILDLKDRGFLLAVCSKNTERIVKNVFENHPDMLIALEDISIFIANWDNKVKNILEIAKRLNLGLSSLAFIDDNPVERDSVRTLLPEVAVIEIGDDPSFYPYYVLNSGYFNHPPLSNEDKIRHQTIKSESERKLLLNDSTNFKEYLLSLKMEVNFELFNDVGIDRVHSLINKTNQFNLSNLRLNLEEINLISASNDFYGIQIRFKDKFSNFGIISVVILEKINNDLFINNWYMSCRVFERGIEDATINEIIKIAQKEGVDRIVGEYFKTQRNTPVAELYKKFGFHDLKSSISSNLIKSQNKNSKFFYINISKIKNFDHSLKVKSVF